MYIMYSCYKKQSKNIYIKYCYTPFNKHAGGQLFDLPASKKTKPKGKNMFMKQTLKKINNENETNKIKIITNSYNINELKKLIKELYEKISNVALESQSETTKLEKRQVNTENKITNLTKQMEKLVNENKEIKEKINAIIKTILSNF